MENPAYNYRWFLFIYIYTEFPIATFHYRVVYCCSWANPYDWDNVNYDTLLGYCDCWGPLGLAKWFRWRIRPYQQCQGVLSSWTGPRSDILVQTTSKTWRSVGRRTTLVHKMMLLHIKWCFFLERISGDIELNAILSTKITHLQWFGPQIFVAKMACQLLLISCFIVSSKCLILKPSGKTGWQLFPFDGGHFPA